MSPHLVGEKLLVPMDRQLALVGRNCLEPMDGQLAIRKPLPKRVAGSLEMSHVERA